MSSALPVEIWLRILHLVVHIPHYLETVYSDPFKDVDFNHSQMAIDEENAVKMSVVIQLVCSSWYQYGKRLKYELTEANSHQRVQELSSRLAADNCLLQLTRRLGFLNFCSDSDSLLEGLVRVTPLIKVAPNTVIFSVFEHSPRPVTDLDVLEDWLVGNEWDQSGIEALAAGVVAYPNHPPCIWAKTLVPLSTKFANLRTLCCTLAFAPLPDIGYSIPPIVFPRIEILQISWFAPEDDLNLAFDWLGTWDVPLLKNLRFNITFRDECWPSLLIFLESSGRTLHWLRLEPYEKCRFDYRVWTYCPRLETLVGCSHQFSSFNIPATHQYLNCIGYLEPRMSDHVEKAVEILKQITVQVQGLAERMPFTVRLAEVTWRFLGEGGADVMEVIGGLWKVCADRGWSLLDATDASAGTLEVKFPSPAAYIPPTTCQREWRNSSSPNVN